MKEYYNILINRIKTTRKLEIFYEFLNGLIISLGISSTAFILMTLIEWVGKLDVTGRTVLFFGFLTISILSFLFFAFNHLLKLLGVLRDEKLEETAIRIGSYFPQLKDKLSNAIQLYPMIANPKGNSPDLTGAAFDVISKESEKYNFKEIINKSKIKKNLLKSLIPILLLFILFITTAPFSSASYRLVNYSSSFIPPAPFTIKNETLKGDFIRGEDIEIIISSTGTPPESITLKIKEDIQKEFDEVTLKLDSNNYSYKIPSAKNSITFFAEANWMGTSISTETGKINVIELPLVKSIDGILRYPNYTGIQSRQFTEKDADISALVGSNVNIKISSNKNIQKAFVVYKYNKNFEINDSLITEDISDTLLFNVNSEITTNAEINFKIKESGKYFVKVIDENGKENPNPIEYGILSMTDNFPSISLISPVNNVELNKDALLPINVTINDDFGFSDLKLYYKMIESKYSSPDKNYRSITLEIPDNQLNADVYHIWNLNKLSITPEDKYEFYLEVADNDIVTGPKKSKTNTLTVRLPSIEEVLSSSDSKQKQVEKNLEEMMKEAEDLSKDISEFNREMTKKKKNEKLNWEDKKKAEEILKKQNELRDKFDDLRNDIQETTEKLQQNNMLSEETLRKYQELQRLMQEVNSPQLKQMQQKMNDAMQQMSPEDMKKAMQEMEFNEEQFQKSIERTKKILERMKAEQKIDALKNLADEMVKEQQEIMDQTQKMDQNDTQKSEELKNKQNNLSEKLDFVEKEMQDLEELMKNLEDETLPMEQMQEAQESLQKENTQQEMQNANQQMNQDKQKAKQSQQNAKNNMQEFAKQMQKLKEQMEQMTSQQAIKQMQKSINDLLELSEEQENLKNQSANSSYNSTKVPEIAKEQSKIAENLNNVAQDMSDLSEKSFAITPEMGKEITNAMKEMNEAMQQMNDRRMNNTAQAQSGAMKSLNNAVAQMQSMLGKMQEQGNGTCPNPGGQGEGQGQGQGSQSGFSQQLQQMAAQQQMLNQAMQQMSGQGQSGGMSQEQRAEMGRLTDKQGQAKASLEEMAEQEKEFSKGSKSQSKELKEIANEMEEVIKDLKSNNLSAETMKRQERILSRLLDATKSVHERDFEKKRESKEGKKFNVENPDAIDFEDERLRQALNDLLNRNKLKYSKDYEILIKNYFNKIQENQNKANE